MSWVAAAVAGGTILGGFAASGAQKDAAQIGADSTLQSTQLGIAQQNKQFEAIQGLLAPYVGAGTGALTGQQNLLGLNGNGAQQSAINGITGGAQYQAIQAAGNNSILQNASATGGLRGGNVQAGLAQFNQGLLAQQIQQQYQNLGGLTSIGQNAAAGVGNAGMNTGNQITSLLQTQGAANAGNALAQGKADSQLYNTIGNAFGTFLGKL